MGPLIGDGNKGRVLKHNLPKSEYDSLYVMIDKRHLEYKFYSEALCREKWYPCSKFSDTDEEVN